MGRSVVVLALAAALLAGCGEKPEPPASRVTAVTGTVDLKRPAAAPPDAGSTTGHRAPATASTTHTAFAFSGRVAPASSTMTLRPAGTVAVRADGTFRARARKLERGANRLVLEGRAAGLTPWKLDIAITRK